MTLIISILCVHDYSGVHADLLTPLQFVHMQAEAVLIENVGQSV